MQTKSTLERAFELARSGECKSLTDLLTKLRREGFENVRRHLDGAGIQRQLRDLMNAANKE